MLYRIALDIDTDRPPAEVREIVDDPRLFVPIARSMDGLKIRIDRVALIRHPTGASVVNLPDLGKRRPGSLTT
jgi:hypothetical protein